MRGKSSPSETAQLCRDPKRRPAHILRPGPSGPFPFAGCGAATQNRFTKGLPPCRIFTAVNKAIWILSTVFALTAGVTDVRWRRIPNWLTYPAIPGAILLHWLAGGSPGAMLSLKGAALGLGLLLPFVLLRSLGGGDWKLVGGLGAFFGPSKLIEVLIYTLLINGLMALCLVIWKRRVGQTLRNLGRMTAAFFSLHLPGNDLTIDNPEAIKVPFGVAAAIAVLLYTSGHAWGAF